MTDKQKKVLYRIIATALLYAVLLVMEHIVKPAFMEHRQGFLCYREFQRNFL